MSCVIISTTKKWLPGIDVCANCQWIVLGVDFVLLSYPCPALNTTMSNGKWKHNHAACLNWLFKYTSLDFGHLQLPGQ